jgi:hypothetical protein
VIEPTEAETVKQIFAWYVYGDGDGLPMGAVAIVDKLNALGVRTRKGGRWLPGVVYSILKAEIYTGTWQGYRYQDLPRKDGARNAAGKLKRKRTRRPPEAWRPVAVPAIVDRGTWQAARTRLADGRYQGRETALYEYLLSGRLVCSCGYHMQGYPCTSNAKKYLYYRCGGKDRRNTNGNCDLPGFRVDTWDPIVWNWVHDLMLHPEKLLKGARAEQAARRRKSAGLLKRLERERAKVAGYDADLGVR